MQPLFWRIVPVILATVLWNTLDASPVLWLYDGVCRILVLSPWSLPSLSSAPRGQRSLLANQTVWVTGASSGIGAAIVCELVQSTRVGHVILSARRVGHMQQVVEKCQAEAATAQDSSGKTTTTFSIVPYDAMIANQTVIKSVVEQANHSSPTHSIDMLILNSGIYQVQPAWNTSAAYRNQLVRVNVQAPVDLSQILMEQNQWKERQKGHLVVVSSMTAKGPQSLSSTYGATKAALRSYFQSLSTEEGSWLTVSMILPGATSTNMWETVHREKKEAEDSSSTTSPSTMMIRPDTGTCMTPERVAQLSVRAILANHGGSLPACFFFYEVWIAKASGLLYGYMSHYTPTLFYFANHLVGLARLEAWKEYQMDMLEIPALIQTLVRVLYYGRNKQL